METALEKILSSCYKEDMMAYMEAHPSAFDELIKLSFNDQKKLSPRATWLISNCMKINDSRIIDYIPSMIEKLTQVRDGQCRDFINILFKMELDEDSEGTVFDTCVEIWCKPSKISSVRYNAFKLIIQVTNKHPDLYQEVKLLLHKEYIDSLSNGIRKSLQKMLTKFEKRHKIDHE